MSNILIVFHYYQYPLRATIRDHLYSFRKYSNHRCYYFNLALQKVPKYVKKIRFDLIIFHTIFLSTRWNLDVFRTSVQKARFLKNIDCIKIAFPQDEFMNTKALCDFINEFGIQHVFSVAPESEWPKIYSTLDFGKVRFHQVLTGYLDDELVAKVNRMKELTKARQICIGYRSWRAEPWLGSHGILKTKVADLFEKKARERGLRIDISTKAEDTILGDKWYRFLLNCKYTIGVEGGASILDSNGGLREQTNQYLATHPNADFEEIREACLKGFDNYLRLFVISPRHLEACLTRTCQVLVEGRYNNILTSGKHYIELKRDFENIEQVLDIIGKDLQREEIVEHAYQDIVGSGRYSYQGFVRYVLQESIGHIPPVSFSLLSSLWERIAYFRAQVGLAISWLRIAFYFMAYVRGMKFLTGLIWRLRCTFDTK